MNSLAVLTPVYNRKELIMNLYDSLLNQDSYDFTWYICDDGSSDGLFDIKDVFVNDKFKVVFIRKENGGKHTALNYSYNYIEEDLIFFVDSDDTLTTDAISTIISDWQLYKWDPTIGGLCYYRVYKNGEIIGNSFKDKNNFVDFHNNVRINQKIYGDKTEIYRTHIMKEHLFPEYPNERFLSECVVWNKISQDGYKNVYISKGIYVCEYLPGGLSNTILKQLSNSPLGWYSFEKSFFYPQIYFEKKIVHYIGYGVVFFYTHRWDKSDKKLSLIDKLFVFLFLPLAFFMSIRLRRTKDLNSVYDFYSKVKKFFFR